MWGEGVCAISILISYPSVNLALRDISIIQLPKQRERSYMEFYYYHGLVKCSQASPLSLNYNILECLKAILVFMSVQQNVSIFGQIKSNECKKHWQERCFQKNTTIVSQHIKSKASHLLNHSGNCSHLSVMTV